MSDGFAVRLPLEGPFGVFAGGRGTLSGLDFGARPQNWQDRGIILAKLLTTNMETRKE